MIYEPELDVHEAASMGQYVQKDGSRTFTFFPTSSHSTSPTIHISGQPQSLYMPSKKVPHRSGYKWETQFPRKGSILLKPVHGAGPRCRVDYSPQDDGPWTMVQIMRVDDEIEHFTCAMPRYYSIPLILINKRLAFFEAQCAPDGTPLPRGDGSHGLDLRELKEYTYLWRLRSTFLQALFDMNHERRLEETWHCDRIHGYVHRTYKRYGHDMVQRHTYWKDEVEAGRIPYATPDVAEMGTFVPAPTVAVAPIFLTPSGPADVFFTAKTGGPSLPRK